MTLRSSTKYKFLLLLLGVMSIFAMSFAPDVRLGNEVAYGVEREIEETQEQKKDLEFVEYKRAVCLAKGKNIPLYASYKLTKELVKKQVSVVLIKGFEFFTQKVILENNLLVVSNPNLIVSVSPRYLLFHCLVFYC